MTVRSRLQEALSGAMKERDRSTVNVLRSTLAAIDNAGAVTGSSEGLAIEASPVGAGSTDVSRQNLSDGEVAAILRQEAIEREDAAALYRDAGQVEHAEALLDEAVLIRSFLD